MRRFALQLLIASIVASALVGIYVLVVGRFDELEVRVLLTSISVSALSVLAMASATAIERRRLGFVPHLGIAASALAFVLVMIGVWAESDSEILWKSMLSFTLFGIAAALSALLSIATLAARFRWVPWIAYATAFAIAAVMIGLAWEILDESDGLWRTTGVMAILLGAAVIATPVLHRMSAPEQAPATATPAPRLRFCVACGKPVEAAGNRVSCAACGTSFRATLDP